MLDVAQIDTAKLNTLSEIELRDLAATLLARIERDAREITWRDAKIETLSFEMAQLKRVKFGVKSEQLDAQQKALFDEAVDADIAALEAQLEELRAQPDKPAEERARPKRAPLPAHLPRVEHHHEPKNTTCTTRGCGCQLKRIGEDVSEKLDTGHKGASAWPCARRVHCRAPHPRQMELRELPHADAGAGACRDHRQGHPDRRAVGAGAGG